MTDAAGIDREPGMGYCEEFHKDDSGCYALVVNPDGSKLWRFRNGTDPTIEAPPHEYDSMHRFRSAVMDEPHMTHYEFGWTNWKGIYSQTSYTPPRIAPDISASVWSQIMGTLLILLPFVIAYWVLA